MGVSNDGTDLVCLNPCLVHPWKTFVNVYGKALPLQINFCAFHTRYCIDSEKLHGEELVAIRHANKFSLCNECYVHQVKALPPILARTPGICRSSKFADRNLHLSLRRGKGLCKEGTKSSPEESSSKKLSQYLRTSSGCSDNLLSADKASTKKVSLYMMLSLFNKSPLKISQFSKQNEPSSINAFSSMLFCL